jgi:hypothetical protein
VFINNRVRKYPPNTIAIPIKLLARIFRTASFISLSRTRFIVSSENEEKVVNPPKNPINKKVRIYEGIEESSQKAQTIPISKDPDALTTKVPRGKTVLNNLCASPAVTYLARVPSAPPVIRKRILITLEN